MRRRPLRRSLLTIAIVFTVLAPADPAAADFTSSLSGTTATMTGDAGSDTIAIDVAGGLYRHNRFSAGDAGFNSDFDFNSTTAGDQTIAAVFLTARVNVVAGAGSDSEVVGSAAAPASSVLGVIDFSGGTGSDSVDFDNSTDTTGRLLDWLNFEVFIPSVSVARYSETESVRAELGSGGDTAVIQQTAAGVDSSLSTGAGTDLTEVNFFGGPAILAGPILVDGGGGTDSLGFLDALQTEPHTYNVGSSTIQRDASGPIAFEAIESASLTAGAEADTIAKRGTLPFVLKGGKGDDLILSRDTVGDTVDCGEGSDTVLISDPLDTLTGDCETTDRQVAPAPAPVTTTVTVPGPVAPTDTQAPAVTLGGLPAKLTVEQLLKGVTVTVTPSEPSALEVDEFATARGATLSRAFNLTLAHAARPLASGAWKVKLKADPKLVGQATKLTAQIRVVATDAAGNRSTITRVLKAKSAPTK